MEAKRSPTPDDSFGASVDALYRFDGPDVPRVAGPADSAPADPGPSDRLLAGEDRILVAEAFAELPPRWRAVLWLTEVERLSSADAGPLLGLTPESVSELTARAGARLRRRYVELQVRSSAAGDCEETNRHLAGLVGGDLTAVQATRVRGHLAECQGCRGRLVELEIPGVSRRTAPPRTSGGVRWPHRRRRPTRGRSRALWPSPAGRRVTSAVAAGLLVIGLGAVVARHADRGSREGQVPVQVSAPGSAGTDEVAASGSPVTLPATDPSTTTAAPPVAPPSGATPTAFTRRGPLAAASPSYVAYALVGELAVYDAPGAGPARRALANPQRSGAPLVLLVTEQRGGWLQVLLPVRPNGSTGWVRADEVTVTYHPFRIVVELGAHRITAYQGTEVLLSEPIGVGPAAAPSSSGLYTKELIQPLDRVGRPDPDGPYGPYAYGLSGYSDVLYDFADDGQFGIHGTDDPGGLGTDVSHGCIRMSNAGITRLAGILPLGVPVEILA